MYKNYWYYFYLPRIKKTTKRWSEAVNDRLSIVTDFVSPYAQRYVAQPSQAVASGVRWTKESYGKTIAHSFAVFTLIATGVASPTGIAAAYAAPEINQSITAANANGMEFRDVGIYTPVMMYPVENYTISSYFGYRSAPCSGCSTNHRGVDLNPGYGATVRSAMNGTIVSIGWDGELGYDIVITDNHGWNLYYAHLIANSVPSELAVGQKIAMGTPIGLVGCTGECTGPHLHFAITDSGKFIDPLPELKQYAK
jgi:murein DD-endopeptidase MepM/ murein hydrolase activator NlpD